MAKRMIGLCDRVSFIVDISEAEDRKTEHWRADTPFDTLPEGRDFLVEGSDAMESGSHKMN